MKRKKKYLLPPPLKFLLSISLFVSLSGCAGSGTWNNNWNNSWNNNNWSNITGGVRDYGKYPTPNAVTCFINPTLEHDILQGLENLALQKEREGIPAILLVKNYLIPATNQIPVQGNAQPLNALFAQIQPPTLANFMIGCNEVMVQERQQLIQGYKTLVQEREQLVQEREQLVQEREQLVQDNKKLFHIKSELEQERATWQHYLNTTPAPQPTAETCNNNYFSKTVLRQADIDLVNLYESKPLLLAVRLALYIPYQLDLLEKFLNIRTLQGLQNFQQQLQKKHLLTDGAPPSVSPLPPPPPPPINWAQYKITFSSVLAGAIERMFDPLLIKTSIRKLEQQLQGVHQQLQGVHQQLQGVHQQLQGVHQQLQELHQQLQRFYQHSQHIQQSAQTLGVHSTPQEILNVLEPEHFSGNSRIINYVKAAIASQNGNWSPLIAIYKQVQPKTWGNFFATCYQGTQQAHLKAKVENVF
ncbi:MAG: hypothetical protein II846_04030 [Acetobacter sp.]|nr:hypothetical protein [Acetobacter sp.]